MQHIGILTLSEAAGDAERRAITEGLAALVGQVDGLLAARTATDLGLTPGNADLIFELTFADEASWRAYGSNPAHKQLIADHIAPVLQAKTFLQIDSFTDTESHD